MEKHRQFLYALIASAVVTAMIGAGFLRREDRWAQDWIFQRQGSTTTDIVIIGIDEEALEELGPYNTWDRNVMASALEALAADPEKKPAVTAIDVLYTGHTSKEADLRLAAAAQELGNVITGSMVEFGKQVTWIDGHASLIDPSAVVNYLQPYEELRACTTQGHINAMSDLDGVMRHGLLYVEAGEAESAEAGARVYSMSYQAAQMYLQAPVSDWEPGEADDGADFLKEAADGDPLYYIPYTGRPGDFYDGVSIAQVIRGEVPADYWAGRIVLIGPYAVGLQDAYFTPIDKGEQMYGVEIQANIIQSFLEKNVKKEIPDAPQLAVVFVLCAASMVLFLNQLVLNASLSAGLLAVLCPVGTINLYKVGFVTHPLWGAVGVAAGYVLAMVGHYGRTVRERQALALEQERIGAELELANRIQASALPKEFPERKEFSLYASMTPAKMVGGDFYDFFMIDEGHLGLVIADVSGKGVPAALFMMVSSALIRQTTAGHYSPARILQSVNHQICARNPEEMFVTVWLGILEIATGKLTAANAGHEYPMVKKAGESFEMLRDRHGLVVGAMDGVRYRDYEIQLEPGAKLFVYTDGVSEAVNKDLEQFGTERILESLRSSEDGAPREILEAVSRAVNEFAGGAPQFDDLTMMCVEYRGA